MTGHVRVVNQRAQSSVRAAGDECVIPVDRSNPIFGNKHILVNPRDRVARDNCVNLFEQDLQKDISEDGPMRREIEKIARRILAGERIALSCWCFPKRCHGLSIAREIRKVAKRIDPTFSDPFLTVETLELDLRDGP